MKRILSSVAVAALAASSLVIYGSPTAGAVTFTRVGAVQENSCYRSVVDGKTLCVWHSDKVFGAHRVQVGTRWVWETSTNPPGYSWGGPGLHVTKPHWDGDPTIQQRACFDMRGTTALAGVSLVVSARRPLASQDKFLAEKKVAVGTSWSKYCVDYILKGRWKDIEWRVQLAAGKAQIDKVLLYQGGASSTSIINEIAAKPGG